jgi:quinoprotein glucose dehydrogenase
MRRLCIPVLLSTSFLFTLATAQEPGHDPTKPFEPKLAAASKEPEQAMKRVRLPSGTKIELFAAEPLLANPVAFCFDEKGRCYVAETYRIQHGVTDNRGHMYWLDDDLASRTVADRVAMYKKHLKDKFSTYEIAHDRVRMLEDTKGTGTADKATVFADGFHSAADGIGAGVLARKGNVYFTCIPNLWLLKDTKGTGKADVRKALSTGYGVHVSFYGHDMHGLRMGPDGRLYFSIGDRGLNVKTAEGKTLAFPDTGAVLRCAPDGSNLEVYAYGLRNPQELAFDEFGNLFTGDNNSDSGDKARLVYVVEGGDSGWRIGYQYGTKMSDRGPWNAEKLWHLQHEGQPAYIVPPIAHIADGPSGLTYNPGGAALPDRYDRHFFLCDFRGTPNISGVRSFAVKPKGAGFEMVDQHECIWSVLATDCDFGPDGGLYVSDWVQGWEGTGKGRIYRVVDPEKRNSGIAEGVKKLLAEGFDKRSVDDLAKLLEHPDMRVRQEAQFSLAVLGKRAVVSLCDVAKDGKNQLARIHAIWALGQIARKDMAAVGFGSPLWELTKDADPEIRTQAVRTLGDSGLVDLTNTDKLWPLLKDQSHRVRFATAIALSHAKHSSEHYDPLDAKAVIELLRENAGKDSFLQHAGVMALSSYPAPDSLIKAGFDPSPFVRTAVLLALRRIASGEARLYDLWPEKAAIAIGRFLSDKEPPIRVEAARAIHDLSLAGAMPALAAMLDKSDQPESLVWRALNAHFRLGKPENAAAIAAFAARADAPEKMRLEAMRMLGDWAKPGRRDRVTGETMDLDPRDAAVAADALRKQIAGILAGPNDLRQEAARLGGQLGIKEVGPTLFKMLAENKVFFASGRVEIVLALDALNDERLPEAMKLALADDDARVRNAGRKVLAKRKPHEAVAALREVLEKGETVERQAALQLLGQSKEAEADTVLSQWLDRLLTGKAPPAIHLELIQAAESRSAGEIKQKLAKHESSRKKDDSIGRYRESLEGGNARAGRDIFLTKTEVACLRCHKVRGQGGEVGPDLSTIGSKQTREYILESIVDPNKQIAKGFETVVLVLKDGTSVSGVLKEENAKEVRLITPEATYITVAKKDVDARDTGKSAMPEDAIKHLSKSELRDLVEFLAGLK